MFNKILVPLDGTDNAEQIGGWVAGLARAVGAEIMLLSVVDPELVARPASGPGRDRPEPGSHPLDAPASASRFTGSDAMGGSPYIQQFSPTTEHTPGFGTQVVDQAVLNSRSYLDGEAKLMRARGLKVSTLVTIGSPVREIVSIAAKEDVDMIAMATHRGSSLARGILGSVTDRVIRSTHVPVLTVRPGTKTAFTNNAGAPNVVIVPLDRSELSEQAVPAATAIAERIGVRYRIPDCDQATCRFRDRLRIH
ncbi:MAG: universal stress protein [Chloroflexi bacterium]|nr:universal stress protein [Chloroflexota bacterium]